MRDTEVGRQFLSVSVEFLSPEVSFSSLYMIWFKEKRPTFYQTISVDATFSRDSKAAALSSSNRQSAFITTLSSRLSDHSISISTSSPPSATLLPLSACSAYQDK